MFYPSDLEKWIKEVLCITFTAFQVKNKTDNIMLEDTMFLSEAKVVLKRLHRFAG